MRNIEIANGRVYFDVKGIRYALTPISDRFMIEVSEDGFLITNENARAMERAFKLLGTTPDEQQVKIEATLGSLGKIMEELKDIR